MKVDMCRINFRQLLVVLLLLPMAHGAIAEDLKVFISADMEGIAGVVTQDQLGPI